MVVWAFADTSGTELDANSNAEEVLAAVTATDLYYSVSTISTVGGTFSDWSEPALILEQSGTERLPTLAQDPDGTVRLAWVSDATVDSEPLSTIYTNTFDPSTQTWSDIETVVQQSDLRVSKLLLNEFGEKPAIYWTDDLPKSYVNQVLDTDAAWYFRLNEADSSTAVNLGSLGNSYNGVYTTDGIDGNTPASIEIVSSLDENGNANSALFNPITLDGDPDAAAQFSAGAYLSIPAGASVLGNTYSIEFWVNLDSLESGQVLVEKRPTDFTDGSDLNADWSLKTGSGGTLVFDVGFTSGGIESDALETDTWYYVVATLDSTYDGTEDNPFASLYIDGVLVGQAQGSEPQESNSTIVAGLGLNGKLDELAIYSTLLTTATDPTVDANGNVTNYNPGINDSNAITGHYEARFNLLENVEGDGTFFSVYDEEGWGDINRFSPEPAIEQTQTLLERSSVFDLVSTIDLVPDNEADLYAQISLSHPNDLLTSITVTDSAGTVWSTNWFSEASTIRPLGVVQGDRQLGGGNGISKRLLAESETFDLYFQGSDSSGETVTVTYDRIQIGDDAVTTMTLDNVVLLDNPSSSGTIGNIVTANGDILEKEVSSLEQIDSGLTIDTSENSVGASMLAGTFLGGNIGIAVSAPFADTDGDGSGGEGSVLVLTAGDLDAIKGNNEGTTLNPNAVPSSGNGVRIFDSSGVAQNLGFSLATGDVNGDGTDDLVIGAPLADDKNGAVYVVFGESLSGGQTVDLATSDSSLVVKITGFSAESEAGYSLAVGDLDGVNGDEILVGAPYALEGVGEVYLIKGGSDISSGTTPSVVFTGETNSDDTLLSQAGFSVDILPVEGSRSFSGDGNADVVIGAPQYSQDVAFDNTFINTSAPSDAIFAQAYVGAIVPDNVNSQGSRHLTTGRVYVLVGNGDGTFDADSPIIFDGSPIFNTDAEAGFSISGAGDINDDGIDDLVIGAPKEGKGTGQVYVVAGGQDLSDRTSNNPVQLAWESNLIIAGPEPHAGSGHLVTDAGDFNGDGVDDLVISSPQAGYSAGQIHTLFGTTSDSANPLWESGNYRSYYGLATGETGSVQTISDGEDYDNTIVPDLNTFVLNGNNPQDGLVPGVSNLNLDGDDDGTDDLLGSTLIGNQVGIAFGHPWLVDEGSLKLKDLKSDQGFIAEADVDGIFRQVVEMLGDLNGDGFEDIVIAQSDSRSVIVFGGNTKALLDESLTTQEVTLTHSTQPEYINAGDVNGDGLADTVAQVINDNSSTLYLLLGSQEVGTQGTQSLSDLANSSSEVSGQTVLDFSPASDINGDGLADWLVQVSSTEISVFQGVNGEIDSIGWKIETGDFDAAGLTVIGDANGDGFNDYIALSQDGESYTPTLFFGPFSDDDGDGSIKLSDIHSQVLSTYTAPVSGDINQIVVDSLGDINGDGYGDFSITSAGSATGSKKFGVTTFYVSEGNNASTYSNQLSFGRDYTADYFSFSSNVSLAGDYNGDGIDDVLFAGQNLNESDSTGTLGIVFGNSELQSLSGLVDLDDVSVTGATDVSGSSLDLTGVGTINAISGSNAGTSISGGSDVNADGFADISIGTDFEDNLSYVLFGGDFDASLTQGGTVADDVLKGTPTGDIMIANGGIDFLYGNGGTDALSAGGGNDVLVVADENFRRIDGGSGLDVLKFAGELDEDWNLTDLSTGFRIQDIEIIDLRNYGNNALILNKQSVLNLSSTSNTLIVDGDVDNEGQLDTISDVNGDFTFDQTISANGLTYDRYLAGEAELFVTAGMNLENAQQVLSLDGINSYVSIPDSDAIDFGADDDFTVEAWIKVDAVQPDRGNNDNDIIEKWSGSGGYPYVIRYERSSGKVSARRFESSPNRSNPSVASITSFDDGKFHHIAFVKEGETLSLYVDGELEDTATDTTSANTTNDSPLFIGNRGGSTGENFFAGEVDELRIWSKARTATEIRAARFTTLESISGADGLEAYYTFDDGTANDSADDVVVIGTGNDVDGILNGNASTVTVASRPFNTSETQGVLEDILFVEDYQGILGSDPRTVEMWINLSFPSQETVIEWGGNSKGSNWEIGVVDIGNSDPDDGSSEDAFYVFYLDINGGRIEGSTNLFYNTSTNSDGFSGWHHIAVVQDNSGDLSNVKLYVDGFLETTTLSGSITTIDTGTVNGGSVFMGSNTQTYRLDDLRIWNTARTQEELRSDLYVSSLDSISDELELYYTFDDVDGDQVEDASGNDRTGSTSSGNIVDVTDRPVVSQGAIKTGEDGYNAFFGTSSTQAVEAQSIPDNLSETLQSFEEEGFAPESNSPIVFDSSIEKVFIQDQVVSEAQDQAKFSVFRNGNTDVWLTLKYEVHNLSAQTGVHFESTKGQIVFAPDETQKTITVPIIQDDVLRQDIRSFEVRLLENIEIGGALVDDLIFGGDGDDVLRGDRNSRNSGGTVGGDDVIDGGGGNDRIGGKAGNDILLGGSGNDQIWGDDGDDILRGGFGNDTLTGDDNSGGQGSDIFIVASGEGTDKIKDFKPGIDFIGLAGGLLFDDLTLTGKKILFENEILLSMNINTSQLSEESFVIF